MTAPEPHTITLISVDENDEDDYVTLTFDMDEDASVTFRGIGMEFALTCMAHELDLQYVLANLKKLKEYQHDEPTDRDT